MAWFLGALIWGRLRFRGGFDRGSAGGGRILVVSGSGLSLEAGKGGILFHGDFRALVSVLGPICSRLSCAVVRFAV